MAKSFSQLFDHHLRSGTGINSPRKKPWTSEAIAKRLNVSTGSIANWRKGRNSPDRSNFEAILRTLFGERPSEQREEFIRTYNSELQFKDPLDASHAPVELVSDEFTIAAEVVQQVAAAYQFGIHSEKIAPQPPEVKPINSDIAHDLYSELYEKVIMTLSHVQERSQDRHVINSLRRLHDALKLGLEQVRSGVVQSRLRTIESIRDAYDTEEGRDQTFPEFRAMIDDVWQTGQDFLTQFPEVREIERQRVALEVERSPESIDHIVANITEIRNVAASSGIVTSEALDALVDTLPQIETSTNPTEKVNLIGDSILTARNFLSAAIRAVATTSKDGVLGIWSVIGDDLGAGAKNAAQILPTLAVIALFTHIAGPVGGIAALLKSDIFRSVSKVVSKMQRQ